MEAKLTLEELEAILDAAREKEYRNQKFLAALKGIDLDSSGDEEDSRDQFERIKIRAEAKARGENPDHAEFNAMGIDIEVEE